MAQPDVGLELFFDGECPLCRREVAMLRRMDRRHAIRFTDIASADFDATAVGSDLATLMGRIHARLASGELIEGVEVFRRAYEAVGLGPLVALTRWPLIARVLDRAYVWFAANRLRLTGRSEVHCDSDRCAVPSAKMSGGIRSHA